MNVMGLNVQYTASTKFEWDDDLGSGGREGLGDPGDIAMGWVVEVHGLPSDTGIVATRIEAKSENWMAYADELEMKGTLTATSASAVEMGTQRIALDNNTDTSDMPNDTARWAGMYVEVKTNSSNVDPTARTITATEVEPEERDSGRHHDEDEAEVHGIFNYDGQTARVNGEIVRIADRISPDTLQRFNGAFVEVEGRYENGILVVFKIKHDDD